FPIERCDPAGHVHDQAAAYCRPAHVTRTGSRQPSGCGRVGLHGEVSPVGTGLDADACRDHLGILLTEEIEALRELEDLLNREYDVLGAKNVAAIERTALIRQQKM